MSEPTINCNKKYNVLFVSSLGNVLEYYEFGLYGFLAPIFAELFFPNENSFISIIAALSSYAVGFFVRPIGSLIFGYIGDAYSRKKALTLSISFMALGSAIMALAPTYEQVGIISPIIVILARMLQGLCLGGEYGGAVVFALEHSLSHSKGLSGGLIASSTLVGCCLGTLTCSLFSLSILPLWAWRVPFLIGILGAFIGLYIRLKIPEDLHHKDQKTNSMYKHIKTTLKEYSYNEFLVIAVLGLASVMSGFTTTYLNIFLTKIAGWSLTKSLLIVSYSLLFYIFISPYAGVLAQRYGPHTVLNISALIYFFLIIFCTIGISSLSPLYIFLSVTFLSINSAFFWGASNFFIFNLFPQNVRYFGIAFGDGIARALLGGLTPFVCISLIELSGNNALACIYPAAVSLLYLFIVASRFSLKVSTPPIFIKTFLGINRNLPF